MLTKKCLICGNRFEVNFSRKNTAKFCSCKCYQKTLKGNTRGFQIGQTSWNKGKSHSKEAKEKMRQSALGKYLRENNGMWKGGKIKSRNRWYILKPEHPFATKQGYVLQSHLVVEECLGRYLTRIEIIHHINENILDDRPENLYLFATKSEHTSYHGNQHMKSKPKLKSNIC